MATRFTESRPEAPHVGGHAAAGRRSCRSTASRPSAGRSCRSSRAGRRRRRARSARAGRPARARRPTRRSPGTCSWPPMTRIVPTDVRASAMASRTGTKSGPTTNTLACGVVDDELDLRRGEAPVDVDAARRWRGRRRRTPRSARCRSCRGTRCGPAARRRRRPSPAATRLARSYSSAQVCRRSPSTRAVRSALSAACVRRMSARFSIPMPGRYPGVTSVSAAAGP